jgi:hypothetical protein
MIGRGSREPNEALATRMITARQLSRTAHRREPVDHARAEAVTHRQHHNYGN